MLFLLEYDRGRGEVISLNIFEDIQRRAAEETRLSLELQLNHAKIDREVVLLEAADERALRRTHRRYFERLIDLTDSQPG